MKRVIPIVLYLTLLTACGTAQPPGPGRIYFVRDDAICSLNVVDGQETQLVNYYPYDGMSVSPDGRWLSYLVEWDISQRTSPLGLWVADTRTGRETGIVREVPAMETTWLLDSRLLVIEYPDWHISADGTEAILGTPRYTIFDLETGERTPATWYVPPHEHGRGIYAPTLDCAAIAVYEFDLETPDMLRVLCEGMSESVTLATPLFLGDVVWSSDGQLLAFYAGEGIETWDTWRLYIWHRDTGLMEEIDTGTDDVMAPSWSPDNQWLAFGTYYSQLCVLHLGDKSVHCFDYYLSSGGIPVAWSPDSKHLVLSTCASGVCEQIKGECDCEHYVLVAVDVPSGAITLLATDVDFRMPVWGR